MVFSAGALRFTSTFDFVLFLFTVLCIVFVEGKINTFRENSIAVRSALKNMSSEEISQPPNTRHIHEGEERAPTAKGRRQ